MCSANFVGLGSSAFPLGFPLPHKTKKHWVCAKFQTGITQVSVWFWAPRGEGAELLKPWRRNPCGAPRRVEQWQWMGTAQNSHPELSFVVLNWALSGLGTPESLASPAAPLEAVPECFHWVGSAQTSLNCQEIFWVCFPPGIKIPVLGFGDAEASCFLLVKANVLTLK